jgi:hypothetical protein
MVEHPLQRRVGYNAAQLAVCSSEKMRIRQVQDPDLCAIRCVTFRLNTWSP